MITLPLLYILVGAFFAAISMLSVLDASNPRRIANFLFWGLLALGGLLGTAAHLLLVNAFRVAPTSVVSPMIYTQIVSALVFGYFIFGEVPTATTLLGAAIVSAAGIGLIRTRR